MEDTIRVAAGLIISVVVLRSGQQRPPIGRAAAYVGIVGFVAALANYATRLLAPDIALMVMPINGLLWFVWWIMVSVGLFRLDKLTSHAEIATADG